MASKPNIIQDTLFYAIVVASKRYGPTRKKVKSVQNGATSVAENRLDANELRVGCYFLPQFKSDIFGKCL